MANDCAESSKQALQTLESKERLPRTHVHTLKVYQKKEVSFLPLATLRMDIGE